MKELLEKYAKDLDPKKPQTTNKIKYVTEYVKQWLIIMSKANYTKNINFIDCMCNAGVYKDGDLCTATEVLKLFSNAATLYPDKSYHLYLNDYNDKRTEIFKKVSSIIISKTPTNLHLYMNADDVNYYINKLLSNKEKFNYPNATILFVDPYDFGTVHIPTLKSFCEKYYCELLFNLFTSDWVRNRNNELDKRIEKVIDNTNVVINNKQELVKYIVTELKTGNMKFSFNYEFHTETNVELYQIIFFTPNGKGLEVLKDSLWKTFNGAMYYRNPTSRNETYYQPSFITPEMNEQLIIKNNVIMAREILENFRTKTHLSFTDVSIPILSKTMLKKGHIIEYVLKPLINENKIKKLNENVRKINYTSDFYDII